MADLSQADRDEIARAFLDGGGAGAVSATAASPGTDVRKFFCENWDMIKQVLELLKGYLPTVAQFLVAALIKAGDVLHGKIC